MAATTDASDKLELMQLGNVLDNDVGNTDEATEMFRQILNRNRSAKTRCARCRTSTCITQNWERLFEVYEKELDVVGEFGAGRDPRPHGELAG